MPDTPLGIGPESRLFFALAAGDEGTLPDTWDEEAEDGEAEGEEEGEETEEDEPKPLDWSIVLSDATGEEAALPLSHDRPLFPQVKAATRRASFLDSVDPSEVVLHQHSYPLADFVDINPHFDPSSVREIRFVFDSSAKGVVIIDDLGVDLGQPLSVSATDGE